jgi:hypothetical protein
MFFVAVKNRKNLCLIKNHYCQSNGFFAKYENQKTNNR